MPGNSRPGLEPLRYAHEEASALAPLRCADADALSASELILLVEEVQDVGADADSCERARPAKVLRYSRVEDKVARELASIGNDTIGIVGPQTRAVDEVRSRHEGAEAVADRVASTTRRGPVLRVVGVDIVAGDIGELVRIEEILARDDVLRLFRTAREV